LAILARINCRPTPVFKYPSLFIASLRVLYFSKYTNFHGIPLLDHLSKPKLW